MKKYPSYTTVSNLSKRNHTKQNLVPKYEKSPIITSSEKVGTNTARTNVLNIHCNKGINYNYLGIQSMAKKALEIPKKQKIIQKIKTETSQNRNHESEKQDFETLKTRLHALQYRLVEIKKSYDLRKKRSQHFSFDNSSSKVASSKENQNNVISLKKELKADLKNALSNKQQGVFRGVQSPKGDVLLQKSNLLKQKNVPVQIQKLQKPLVNSQDSLLLSQYITQYQQKPAIFKNTASETNLLRTQKSNLRTQEKKQQIYYVSTVIRASQVQKPSTFDQLCIGHLLASYQFLCFVKNAGVQKPPKSVIKSLPPAVKKHTIIFDLDETLIHCLDAKKNANVDALIPVLFPDRKQVTVGINIRPYAKQCLKELSKQFQIMIFTASHANYANAIVDYLDPNQYSRQSCHKTQQGFYVKDLRVIDRKLSNILLVDNAAYSYCFQPQNGVPIIPFYDNKADFELKNLIPYLKSFAKQSDVRIQNSRVMKLAQYTNYKGPQDLINRLYKCI